MAGISKDSPPEESDFNKAYKIKFQLLLTEIQLPLFLN
jgi:peroxiredoxin